MRRFVAVAVLLAALPAGAARASEALRIQADGVAALPARTAGAPAPKPPDAATLRTLRQQALANGVENAVLSYASQLAGEESRADEAALRVALGELADYALGRGVLAELGPRKVVPKPKAGDALPPRRTASPIPMEHAWRIEAIVDGDRVRAALQAAGLAFAAGGAEGSSSEVVLEAPYDAASLAALRSRLTALGAGSVVPRRFSSSAVVLAVHGLTAELLVARLESEPPVGFSAQTQIAEDEAARVRVRLTPVSARPTPAKP